MWAVLFAMSWAGILVVLAGIWLLVILIRGLVDFISWLYEVLVIEPRERKQREQLRRVRRSEAEKQAGPV
jgi:hypothetical protein